MRKVKKKEREKAGNIYCDHCKPKKVDAVWRKCGFAYHEKLDFACDKHKNLIKISVENDHLTEADYQTWMKL